MKVMWVGPLTDGTGYSNCSNNSILALDAVGVDVVPRSFKLAGQAIPPPNRVQELMHKSLDGVDTIIQHFLPIYISYMSGFKNIGYFHCETTNFRPSGWQHYLNIMDEVWVSCEENKEAAINSGVKKPIKVVPIPADMSIYARKRSPLINDLQHKYVFYNIGDFSYRKNIMGLVEAYFKAFGASDNVALVLKTYCDGKSTQESQQIIGWQIAQLKTELRKSRRDYDFPPVYIICDYLSTEHIHMLHQNGDCFISLERGAAWNIPAFDAMTYGKRVITCGYGGQRQFCRGTGAFELITSMVDVKNMSQCPHQELYTSHEQWGEPSLEDTIAQMRFAYQVGKIVYDRTEWRNHWDLKTAGNILKEAL